MNTDSLVSRSQLISSVNRIKKSSHLKAEKETADRLLAAVEGLPETEISVRHAHWVVEGDGTLTCSRCAEKIEAGTTTARPSERCPGCGAVMLSRQKEENT